MWSITGIVAFASLQLQEDIELKGSLAVDYTALLADLGMGYII